MLKSRLLLKAGSTFRRSIQSLSALADSIVVSDEVSYAIKHGSPTVALESTIITHGMPYPHNLETAKKVEEIIRNKVCK